MKKTVTGILVIFWGIAGNAQYQNSYTAFIQQDTTITWAAECNKIVDLTPKVSDYSIKQFYLAKLKSGTAIGYGINSDRRSVSPISVNNPGIDRPDWLKEHTPVVPSRSGYIKTWSFISKEDETKGYRVSNISTSACCGCDDAEAIRVKQVLYLKNNRLYTYNVCLSPLCARRENENTGSWFPLCNVAYNSIPDGDKRIVLSNDVVLVASDKAAYNFNAKAPGIPKDDSVLTIGVTESIAEILMDAIDKGTVKAVDYFTGRSIPAKSIYKWNMPMDTIAVTDDAGNFTKNKAVQRLRNPDRVTQLRIQQDWYFDFKNERLFSRIKWIELCEEVYGMDNATFIGYKPFCKIYY